MPKIIIMYAWIEFADIRKKIALSKLYLHFVQMAGAEDGTDNWRHAEADAEGMIGTMMTLFSEMAIFVHFLHRIRCSRVCLTRK